MRAIMWGRDASPMSFHVTCVPEAGDAAGPPFVHANIGRFA
jgi:hypothetical protein